MPTVSTSIKIDAKTKKEAQELFKDMGMSLTTAINIFLKQEKIQVLMNRLQKLKSSQQKTTDGSKLFQIRLLGQI